MRDYISLGSTPCDESCQQVGDTFDGKQAQIELLAYKHQLQRMFPEGYFAIKSFPHDFGSYSEVCVIFDDSDEQSVEIAFAADSACPENWDETATLELIELGYKFIGGN